MIFPESFASKVFHFSALPLLFRVISLYRWTDRFFLFLSPRRRRFIIVHSLASPRLRLASQQRPRLRHLRPRLGFLACFLGRWVRYVCRCFGDNVVVLVIRCRQGRRRWWCWWCCCCCCGWIVGVCGDRRGCRALSRQGLFELEVGRELEGNGRRISVQRATMKSLIRGNPNRFVTNHRTMISFL